MRLYLSATMDAYIGRIKVPVQRGLISFGTIHHGPKLPVGLDSLGWPEDWCIDSGAHFFISAYFKAHKLPPIADVEKHQTAFVAALAALAARPELATRPPAFVVETDLQELYGLDPVMRWRREVWAPYQAASGWPVCYVWHPCDGMAEWRRLLDDPGATVLGLSGGHNTPKGDKVRMVCEAYEARKPVHGFASFKEIKDVPFTSVDSTSWASGAVFGRVMKFNPHRGSMGGASVGKKALRESKAGALGALLATTRGRVHAADGLGVPVSGLPALQRIYTDAASEYAVAEAWFTSYWKGKGIDWKRQLAGTSWAR